jgi:hypothetical protein
MERAPEKLLQSQTSRHQGRPPERGRSLVILSAGQSSRDGTEHTGQLRLEDRAASAWPQIRTFVKGERPMIRKTWATIAVLFVFVAASNAALAGNSVSGAGLTAWQTSDAPYITHNTQGAYNTDTTSGRYITGSLGNVTAGSGTTVFRVNISGANNGGTQVCWVTYVKVSVPTDAYFIGGAQTSGNGVVNYEVDVTIPAGNSSNYAANLICLLPAQVGGNVSMVNYGSNPF